MFIGMNSGTIGGYRTILLASHIFVALAFEFVDFKGKKNCTYTSKCRSVPKRYR